MEELIRQALHQFYDAVNRLQHGDADAMLTLWSHAGDVTHMGPRGGREEGWDQVQAYYEQAARLARTSPGQFSAHGVDVVIRIGSDLAYASMIERVDLVADGQASQFAARATHIYRREGDAWKLIHRHADAAPQV